MRAYCVETNEKITAQEYNPERHLTLKCELNHPLMVKRGEQKRHHFCHYPGTLCKYNTNDTSEWHLKWQSLNPKQTEIRITREGKTHIADLITEDGRVIEIQHSPISKKEIYKREQFYKNMIWIFDCRHEHTDTLFICRCKNECLIKITKNYMLNTTVPTFYD